MKQDTPSVPKLSPSLLQQELLFHLLQEAFTLRWTPFSPSLPHLYSPQAPPLSLAPSTLLDFKQLKGK